MKFNIRKIASAAASMAMVGATVGLAAAANYPAPFVKDSTADVGLVYGSTAASSDLVAAIDITNSLNAVLGDGTTPTTITGESYALWTSSTKIYLNDSMNKARTVISEGNLPTVLGDGTFEGDVTATYTQKIDVGSTVGVNNRLVYGKHPTSDDDPTLAFDLGTSKGDAIYNLTVTFNKAIDFNSSDSTGETLNLFGQELTVGAETTGGKSGSLVFLKSATKINLDSETNPSEQVTIEGETYTIELVSASDTAATIRVTDSAGKTDTETVNEDKSKTVQGIEIAVTDADETNFALSASVLVGADKIKLTENTAVKLGSNEDTVDGSNVRFGDSGERRPNNLTKIIFQVSAEDSDVDAILEGGEFVDPIFGSLKLTFPKVSIPVDSDDREDIKLDNSGSDKMTVNFQPWDASAPKTINWYYNKTDALRADSWGPAGFAALADSNGDAINVFERMQINKSEYVVVGNEDTGGLWELKTIANDTSTPTNTEIKFENVFTGEEAFASVSADGTGTIDMGTQTYTIDYTDDTSVDNYEWVRLRYQDGSRTTANNAVIYPSIETIKGANLAFYEPITLNLSDWDRSGLSVPAAPWVNITQFNVPDGDGFTAITVTPSTPLTTHFNYSVTVGNGSASNLVTNGSVATSADGFIGKLVFNVTAGVVASGVNYHNNYTATVFLEDISGDSTGTVINEPAIIIWEEQDDSSSQTYEALIVKIEGAGTTAASLGVSDIETTWSLDTAFDEIQMESDSDLYKSADFWGTIITTDQSDTDSYTATISYPDEQMYAELYVAEAGAAVGGDGGALGSVTVKDNEVSQVSSKNLIVVGGSCINTVAASLLGSDTPLCGDAWKSATGVGSGSFLVQTWDSPYTSGKIATLVAGYNAGDTTNAATYTRTQNPMTNVGDKYIGTSATSATLQVA